jgi:hypothetical protein
MKSSKPEISAATSYSGNNHSNTQGLPFKQDQELMSLLGLHFLCRWNGTVTAAHTWCRGEHHSASAGRATWHEQSGTCAGLLEQIAGSVAGP